MHPRVLGTQKQAVLFLSLLALRAGLAAGPIGAGDTTITQVAVQSVSAHEGPPTAAGGADPASGPATAASVTAPAPPAATGADALVPPERRALQPILVKAALQYDLPADVVQAQAWAESSWRDNAVSGKGAAGVLQLTPATVDFVSHRLLKLDHTLDPLDPTANAEMGARYLRHLLDRTEGDFRQALIAYNQGLSSLRRNGPYQAAEVYADRVLTLRSQFG